MSKDSLRDAISKICTAFRKYGGEERTYLVFTQMLPDSSTQVKIFLSSSKDLKYHISVTNDRSDARFNSSPITEVFKDHLPELRGEIDVDTRQLASILADLMIAKPYFGISVRVIKGNIGFLEDIARLS